MELPKHHDSHDLTFKGSFLKDLPPSIKRYTYHSEHQALGIIDSEFSRLDTSTHASEFVLFHTSKETLEHIFDTLRVDTSSIARLCTSFDTEEELLLVTLMKTPHSAASDVVNTMILETLASVRMMRSLQGYSGATIRGQTRGKQADYGWGPKRRPPGQPDSPSVTLEVAYSESDSKLSSDVRFWLNPDDGNANMCLTLRINRSRPEIRIEKWEKQNDRPHRSQIIWITRRGGETTVSDHPLVVPFESLFRRPPSRSWENDLEISQGQLEEIAETIWNAQGW